MKRQKRRMGFSSQTRITINKNENQTETEHETYLNQTKFSRITNIKARRKAKYKFKLDAGIVYWDFSSKMVCFFVEGGSDTLMVDFNHLAL